MAEGLNGLILIAVFLLFCQMNVMTGDINETFNEAIRRNLVYVKTFSLATKAPIERQQKNIPALDIYCYEPSQKMSLSLTRMWTTVCLKFNITSPDSVYQLYRGSSEEKVFSKSVKTDSSIEWFTWLRLRMDQSPTVCVSPFKRSCAGIDTLRPYMFSLDIIDVNCWFSYCLISGIFLFLFASSICRSSVLYYLVGISFGVLTSVLIVLMIMAKMFPQKASILAVSVFAGGSITLWLLKFVWANLWFIVSVYYDYAIMYLIFSAILSFSVCYYYGPVENPRLLDLMQWAVQIAALMLVYYGTQIPAVSGSIVAILVGFQLLRRLLSKA